MARYAINQEGVEALKKLANGLLISANEIMEAGSVCEKTVRSLGDALGLYEDSILDIIAANRKTLNNNKEDIVDLAVMISHKADEVSEMVQMLLGDTTGGSSGSSFLRGNSGNGFGSSEKRVKTPLAALAAYMCAHNYGKKDYATYSKDPEWQKLHKDAFPEYHQIADHELSPEEKTAWVCSVLGEHDQSKANRIVKSMEFYSNTGYSAIHWDRNASLQETRDILNVFDSGKVPAYKGIIYRGLSFDSKEEVIKSLQGYNGLWKEPGVTSFSADKRIAEDYFASKSAWGLVLTCENNKSAIPFRHISKLSWEDEVLSPGGLRDVSWRIDEKSIRIDKKRQIVYVDIIEI